MKVLISCTLGILLIFVTPCSAQQKTDIRGFFPGMNKEQFVTSLKNSDIECSAKNWEFLFNGDEIRCLAPDKYTNKDSALRNISFYPTKYLSPNLLWKIKYYFYALKSKEDMIALLSSTYKKDSVRPRSKCQESDDVDGFWNLGDTISLSLVHSGEPTLRNNLKYAQFYIVVLCDDSLRAKDLEAEKLVTNEKVRREPPPRF
jgi:hypothetical protein